MTPKTILTCAVTGNITTRDQHPGLPITPTEIAQAVIEAGQAGAAVAHIHARDPATGRGSMDARLFREIVERIRERDPDIILNLSTGEGGRYIPTPGAPQIAAAGSTLTNPERRVAHISALRPDICTLDLNTMVSGAAVVINTPGNVEVMANQIYAAGVLPEIELFDGGDLQMALHMLETGILRTPIMFQVVLGVRYGAIPSPQTLFYFASQLPKDCIWGAFGIGRHEFPLLAQSWLLGGHVRVGLEDNVFIRKGVLARDNAELCEKAVTIVEHLGGSIATPLEARRMLGLAPAMEKIAS